MLPSLNCVLRLFQFANPVGAKEVPRAPIHRLGRLCRTLLCPRKCCTPVVIAKRTSISSLLLFWRCLGSANRGISAWFSSRIVPKRQVITLALDHQRGRGGFLFHPANASKNSTIHTGRRLEPASGPCGRDPSSMGLSRCPRPPASVRHGRRAKNPHGQLDLRL